MYYLMCVVIEGPLLSEVPVSSGRILGENGAQKNMWKPHGLGHHFSFPPHSIPVVVLYTKLTIVPAPQISFLS